MSVSSDAASVIATAVGSVPGTQPRHRRSASTRDTTEDTSFGANEHAAL
jgi:hypothetical protein